MTFLVDPSGQTVVARPSAASEPSDANLLADLAQFGLDILGIFDPTPISDGISGIISLYNGRWGEAGISCVAIVPFVGDLAKVGKLQRASELVGRIIARAATSEKFADAVRPALEALWNRLDALDPDRLGDIGAPLNSLKRQLNAFLKIHSHHLLPIQFVRQFEDVGLNIEKFRIPLSECRHIRKPNGIHTNSGGNWNRVWEEFFDETSKPSKHQILEQLAKMRKEFGI